MERVELAYFKGKVNATGKIVKYGFKNTPTGKVITILLVDMEIWNDEKKVNIEHAWIGLNKKVDMSMIRLGNEISFTCKVKKYARNRNHEEKNVFGIEQLKVENILKEGKGKRVVDFIKSIVNRDTSLAPHCLVL